MVRAGGEPRSCCSRDILSIVSPRPRWKFLLAIPVVTALAAIGWEPPARAASDSTMVILDISEDANVDPALLEDLADQLVYFSDTDVVDERCVRSTERFALQDGVTLRRHLDGLIDTAEASYDDFDADGAWATLQQATSQMAELDPLAHGPLFSRFCRLGALVSVDRGDPAAVEESLQCLVSVQPWFEPAPGQFDPTTEERLEELRDEFTVGAATLEWDGIGEGIVVIVDGFEVGPDDEVLLVPGVHQVQTEREGFAPVRRRIHVEGEVVIELESPTVPRWDDAVKQRLRELLDDGQRADRDPTVLGLMASCEADSALLLLTVWEDDLRSTSVGLVRSRGKGWEYLGRFDTHQLIDRVGEALAPVESDLIVSHQDKPVMGTLGWAIGGAGRLRAPADERMYAGFGFGVGTQFGLRIKRHLHLGPAASFSLMGGSPTGDDIDPAALFVQETLAWVDLGFESGVVFTPGQTRISLVAGGGVTFVALGVAEFVVALGEARATGGWMGARLTFGFPTDSAVRVGPSLQLHHAIVALDGNFTGWGFDESIDWHVSFTSLTQLQLLLAFIL